MVNQTAPAVRTHRSHPETLGEEGEGFTGAWLPGCHRHVPYPLVIELRY